jgi:PAS domain S-box-containing protein
MTTHRASLNGKWSDNRWTNGDTSPGIDPISIFDAIEVPIVVVSCDFSVAGFNRAAAVLGLTASDIGGACLDVPVLAGLPRLGQLCTQAITDGVESRADLRDGEKWFVVRISQYTRSDRQVAGAVLTFTNVTAFRASVNQAIYEREFAKTIINTVANPLVVLDGDQRIQSGNRAFYAEFGLSRDQTKDIPLYDICNGAFESAALRRQMGDVFAGRQTFQPVEVDLILPAKNQRTFILDAQPVSFQGHSERRILVSLQDITARKQAEMAKDLRSEEELRRSEAFLVEGQRLSLTGTFSWEVGTQKIAGSEQFYRIFEFDLGSPVTITEMGNRIHPEDIMLFNNMIDDVRGGQGDFDYECRLRMPDETVKYVQVIAHGSRNTDSRLEYIGAICDVTARRHAEEEVREGEANAEQRLRLVVDCAPVMITSTRPDGFVDYFNKRLLDYLGLSLSDIEGWNWLSSVHPDDAPGLLEKWKMIVELVKPEEYHEARVRRFDGVYRWFLHRAAPMYDQEGKIVRWFGTALDIDDRKNAEEALRRSEAFLSEAQRLSLTGSFSWQVADGNIAWSEQLYRIFEFDHDVPVTLDLVSARTHPEDARPYQEILDRLRRDCSDFDFEYRLQMPDRSVKYLHVIAHGIRNENGRLEYIGAAQDVTQRQEAEAALATARSELARVARSISLGVLTASIAHEVKQPLTAVTINGQACLRLLAKHNLEPEVLRPALEEIVANATRANAVIARIRAFIMKAPTETDDLDVNVVIHEVLALVGHELQRNCVLLECKLAELPALVLADRVQLQQVLLNLIMNGIEAMTEIADQRRVLRVESEIVDSGDVLVTVCDSGVGLGSETDRIFDPFFTTKANGMGMGLAVSRSIIEDHGGRLWASSNHPKGAIFSFTLPGACRNDS